MHIDVIMPTMSSGDWKHKCRMAFENNTNPSHFQSFIPLDGTFQDLPTWLDKMRYALFKEVKGDLVLHIQDDCLILPGNPDWIASMVKPFTVDPAVGVVACTVTTTGFPNQRIRSAITPGYYYTTAFAPILFLAKPQALSDAIDGVKEDLFCDQDVPLNLLEKGWKIVIDAHVAQHHEGMQTNLRVYGGDDPKAWMDKAAQRIKDEVPKRHSAVWCARHDACEMVPMVIHEG